jgi:hypothetical protein
MTSRPRVSCIATRGRGQVASRCWWWSASWSSVRTPRAGACLSPLALDRSELAEARRSLANDMLPYLALLGVALVLAAWI